ncbi:hypothetical protein M0R45_032007 [Rubus argutus]|uniref:Uncharacterized protein n=1 Tax=Rubus argutus TaxID=59490 RepID=A0AAW1WHH0_RUBAR
MISSVHDGGLVKRVPKRLKPNPYLLEVDGKIFRFRFHFCLHFHTNELFVPFNPSESFELFDPNDSQWLPLDLPPCDPVITNGYLPDRFNFEHAVGGSNILRWARECSRVSRGLMSPTRNKDGHS